MQGQKGRINVECFQLRFNNIIGDILVVKKKAKITRCFLALLYNPKGVLKVDSYKDIAVLV
jgi:hypothetical protein